LKDIIAGRHANKWVISALILASIVCASLSSTANVSAQLCPERWETTLQGLKDTYKPGDNIDFTVNYLTRNPSDCSACRQQIIVGMINSSGKVIYVSCVYDGSPQTCPKETSGTGKISWKAPSDVGSYQILAANDYQNSCEGAKANFRVKSSNRLLSTIQVSTSSSAASSTKPAGSDTTGSNQNPFSTFQSFFNSLQNSFRSNWTSTLIFILVAIIAISLILWKHGTNKTVSRYGGSSGSSRYIPGDVRREVDARDRHRCVRCGSTRHLEYDHIKPISQGGSNTVNNIQTLCRKCNRRKSNGYSI